MMGPRTAGGKTGRSVTVPLTRLKPLAAKGSGGTRSPP